MGHFTLTKQKKIKGNLKSSNKEVWTDHFNHRQINEFLNAILDKIYLYLFN